MNHNVPSIKSLLMSMHLHVRRHFLELRCDGLEDAIKRSYTCSAVAFTPLNTCSNRSYTSKGIERVHSQILGQLGSFTIHPSRCVLSTSTCITCRYFAIPRQRSQPRVRFPVRSYRQAKDIQLFRHLQPMCVQLIAVCRKTMIFVIGELIIFH